MDLPLGPYFFCIDTSALLDLKVHYPSQVFPDVWNDLAHLADREQLIAPQEVLAEIEKGDDEVTHWAREHNAMFLNLDEEQLAIVTEIMKKFPRLVDPNKPTPDADPFVIALAQSKIATVLAHENRADPNKKPKIPSVCDYYGIRCIRLKDLFVEQGWKYQKPTEKETH